MAITNVSRKGFDRIQHKGASAASGSVGMYYIPSGDNVACFIGDMMKMSDSAAAASTGDLAMGLPKVVQAAASSSTDIHVGVLAAVNQHLGVSIANTVLSRRHRPASVGMYVMIYDDPEEVFSIQCDDAVTAGLTFVGSNADFVVGTGNATTGRSASLLDLVSATTTATLPLKIVGVVNSPDNSFQAGDLNMKYRVVVNTHARKGGTLGMASD